MMMARFFKTLGLGIAVFVFSGFGLRAIGSAAQEYDCPAPCPNNCPIQIVEVDYGQGACPNSVITFTVVPTPIEGCSDAECLTRCRACSAVFKTTIDCSDCPSGNGCVWGYVGRSWDSQGNKLPEVSDTGATAAPDHEVDLPRILITSPCDWIGDLGVTAGGHGRSIHLHCGCP